MKRIVLTLGCLMALCSPTPCLLSQTAKGATADKGGAKDYYVSPDGADKNPGTRDKPFKTIHKAADIMVAGDTCYVRGGTYRETVKVKNSGTEEEPISFVAWPKETVTISGLEPVKTNWVGYFGYKTWTGEQEKAFQAGAPAKYTQLFVDGKLMKRMDKPEAIDSPKQWSSTNGRIMLWPPEKKSGSYNNPTDRKVEGKVRDFAFEVSSANYVVIRNFRFFATTIKFENCDYCTIDKCCFSQPKP